MVIQVLKSRNIQLYLGYYVSCIKEAPIVENSTTAGADREEMDPDSGKTHINFILQLQPAVRGLESKILEADLVLWTVGSKPLVPCLKPFDQSRAIPLNARGQAETDETLSVKGHPRIFAIGDSAALRDSSGRLLPATAQVCSFRALFNHTCFFSKLKIYLFIYMENSQ